MLENLRAIFFLSLYILSDAYISLSLSLSFSLSLSSLSRYICTVDLERGIAEEHLLKKDSNECYTTSNYAVHNYSRLTLGLPRLLSDLSLTE